MKKTVIVIFIILCLVPAVISLFFPSVDKNYENRPLAGMPDSFTDDFPAEFEAYFSDNFGLRPAFVSIYSSVIYNILGDSPNLKVVAGEDGWLFFGETTQDYLKSDTLTESEARRIGRTLHQMDAYAKSRGIKFLFAVAPNKNTIYGEYMPKRFSPADAASGLDTLHDILKEYGMAYTDLKSMLLSEKPNAQLYHKKDTHWNNLGAMLAFRAIMQTFDLDASETDKAEYEIRKDFYGDLQRMLTPAFRIYDDQIYFKDMPEYEYIRPFRTHDDIRIETVGDPDGARLAMFRDSFANSLIPFFSGSFASVLYLRNFPYDYSLFEAFEPDFLLIEIAERSVQNLLEKPPVFPAIKVEPANTSGLIELSSVENLKLSESKGLLVIQGAGLPTDTYEAYVTISGKDMDAVFEAYTFTDPDTEGVSFIVQIRIDELPEEARFDGVSYLVLR